MQAPVLHHIHDQKLWLSAYRSIYWEEASALIISDCHFGKSGHFRKAGIPIPQQVYREDLQKLVDLISHFRPGRIIVVGDMFHSRNNLELEWFCKWRKDFTSLSFTLVKGNHDILRKSWYTEAGIELVEEKLTINSFSFIHEHCQSEGNEYNFCGHLHPGILLQGQGRQSLRLPCFYFSASHCILPAFSRFTGLAMIDPLPGETIFAVVDNRLVKLQ